MENKTNGTTTASCCDTKNAASSGCNCYATGACECSPGNCGCSVFGIRKKAPWFEATAYYNGFKNVKLSDFKGKYLVLFFYPLDFTFVCPTEIV